MCSRREFPYNQRAWAGPAWPSLGCQAEEPSTTGQEVLTGSAFLVSAGAMVVCVCRCVGKLLKMVGGSNLVQCADRHAGWK